MTAYIVSKLLCISASSVTTICSCDACWRNSACCVGDRLRKTRRSLRLLWLRSGSPVYAMTAVVTLQSSLMTLRLWHSCSSIRWQILSSTLAPRVGWSSPNSITPTFTETSPRTQITKVANTNHLDMSRSLRQSPWQVRDKPVCVALMEFGPLQCTGKVGDKVGDKVRDKFPTKSRSCRGHKSWKSASWFVSRTFMICVRDKSATLSGTCSDRLCRKVGVMEFGL